MPLVRSHSGLLKEVKAEYCIARMTATSKRMGPGVKNDWVPCDCQAGSS
jgi:hypothetical protein